MGSISTLSTGVTDVAGGIATATGNDEIGSTITSVGEDVGATADAVATGDYGGAIASAGDVAAGAVYVNLLQNLDFSLYRRSAAWTSPYGLKCQTNPQTPLIQT